MGFFERDKTAGEFIRDAVTKGELKTTKANKGNIAGAAFAVATTIVAGLLKGTVIQGEAENDKLIGETGKRFDKAHSKYEKR